MTFSIHIADQIDSLTSYAYNIFNNYSLVNGFRTRY